MSEEPTMQANEVPEVQSWPVPSDEVLAHEDVRDPVAAARVEAINRIPVTAADFHQAVSRGRVTVLPEPPTYTEVALAAGGEAVNHPAHYTSHPSGIECIDVTEHAGFNIGNAIKYLWRTEWGSKGDPAENLRKALWYVQRELDKLEGGAAR